MAEILKDCNRGPGRRCRHDASAGPEKADIRVVVMEGMASEGVEAILAGHEVPKILLRRPGICGMGKGCRGTGTGCG
jgi:hypothetical protein